MAVTLTLKKRVKGVWLDDIRASQNFRHFMNLLNSKVYGKRFKRFNKQLKVIPVMEMSASNRLHFHLIIEVPTDCDYLWLQNEVKEIWGKGRCTWNNWLHYLGVAARMALGSRQAYDVLILAVHKERAGCTPGQEVIGDGGSCVCGAVFCVCVCACL